MKETEKKTSSNDLKKMEKLLKNTEKDLEKLKSKIKDGGVKKNSAIYVIFEKLESLFVAVNKEANKVIAEEAKKNKTEKVSKKTPVKKPAKKTAKVTKEKK